MAELIFFRFLFTATASYHSLLPANILSSASGEPHAHQAPDQDSGGGRAVPKYVVHQVEKTLANVAISFTI